VKTTAKGGTVKKVRYMAGMGAAALAPLAAGTVLAAEPANAVVTCTANTAFSFFKVGNVGGHGWHKTMSHQVCIGTVDVSLKFNKTFSKSAFLAVYSENGAALWPKKAHRFEGTKGTTVVTDFTVKELFNTSQVSVCASSTYGSRTCRQIFR
jgi:hypothetical protein